MTLFEIFDLYMKNELVQDKKYSAIVPNWTYNRHGEFYKYTVKLSHTGSIRVDVYSKGGDHKGNHSLTASEIKAWGDVEFT